MDVPGLKGTPVRYLLAILIAAAITAAPASAATFQGSAAQWMADLDANIAYPDGVVVVNWGKCDSGADGCYVTDPDGSAEIRLSKVRRWVALHEMGHRFSATNLDAAERNTLRPMLTKNPTWSACKQSFFEDCAEEMFGDAYMACAMDMEPGTDNWDSGYGWYPSRKTFRRVCNLIWRYA